MKITLDGRHSSYFLEEKISHETEVKIKFYCSTFEFTKNQMYNLFHKNSSLGLCKSIEELTLYLAMCRRKRCRSFNDQNFFEEKPRTIYEKSRFARKIAKFILKIIHKSNEKYTIR